MVVMDTPIKSRQSLLDKASVNFEKRRVAHEYFHGLRFDHWMWVVGGVCEECQHFNDPRKMETFLLEAMAI
jgi:hypothetical protein